MTAVRAEIDEYPLGIAAELLGVALSTLRVWARHLRKAKVSGFDHKPNERIISAQAMKVYVAYKDLLDRGYGLKKAADRLRVYGV